MILNKHGWGLREMIFICAAILFCVILAAVLINQLYSAIPLNNLEESTQNNSNSDTANSTNYNSYKQIENNLKTAAISYYLKNKDNVEEIIVSEELISEGYLKESQLQTNDDTCLGYVIIEDNTFSPYITCENYETEGY